MEYDEIQIIKIKDQLLQEINDNIDTCLNSLQDKDLEKLLTTIQNFQPAPQLLDKHLGQFIDKLCAAYTTTPLDTTENKDQVKRNSIVGAIFYQFTKARGTKTVSACLSSDVYLIEPILSKLLSRDPQQDWKETYFLLLWFAILVLNPFALKTVDEAVPNKIYDLSLQFFVNNSKEADAAAVMLSRFLSRPDSQDFLQKFYEQGKDIENKDEHFQLSYLTTLNSLLKITKLSLLSPWLKAHYKVCSSIIQRDKIVNANLLKMCFKNLGKLACIAITFGNDDAGEDFLEMFEDIIDLLLSNLGHQSTVIRTCIAKQIAKITKTLDKGYQEDVINALLDELEIPNLVTNGTTNMSEFVELKIDYDTINIHRYHGTILTLAELLNSRIVPSTYLPIIGSLLHRTLFLEQNRLTYSVGSNIRDASCYVCWSLLKKYKEPEVKEILKHLFEDLLLTCLFDKEIMIRRAASAVIQELLGRFGDRVYEQMDGGWMITDVAFKLRLIELLDFTTLGDIKKAYVLSLTIVEEFNEKMCLFFMNHLYSVCFHSDYQMRKLALGAFIELHHRKHSFINLQISIPPYYERLLSECANDSTYKQGRLSLLAELIPGVSVKPADYDRFMKVVESQTYNPHRDSWSKGEEILHLVGKIAREFPQIYDSAHCYDLIMSIIRASSSSGSPEVAKQFQTVLANMPCISDAMFEKLVYYLKMGNNTGVAMSLASVHIFTRDQIDTLVDIISDSKQDADVRSLLIDSLRDYFAKKLDFDNDHYNKRMEGLSERSLTIIAIQLDDYTITSQGDVGSKVRLAAIKFFRNVELPSDATAFHIFIQTKLARLIFDRIDKIREEARRDFDWFNPWRERMPMVNGREFFQHTLGTYQTYYYKRKTDDSSSFSTEAVEFWKGYIMLAGATISSNKLTQDSLRCLMEYMKADKEMQRNFFIIFSNILSSKTEFVVDRNEFDMSQSDFKFKVDYEYQLEKTKDRKFKLQNSALLLLVRLYEYNTPFPEDFDEKPLFVKVFNLQLKQTNQTRLKSCFRIFKFMLLRNPNDSFYAKGKDRMVAMLCNPKTPAQIRLLASEILYELYFESEIEQNEKDEKLTLLDRTDWTDDSIVAKYIDSFKE